MFDKTQDNNTPLSNEDPFDAAAWKKIASLNKTTNVINEKSICFLKPNEGKLKKII